MKAFIKKANYSEKIEIVDADIKYRSEFAKHFLGKDITPQFVALNAERTLFMAVDEDGLLKELPFNFFIEMYCPSFAQEQFGMPATSIDTIVGDAVFIKIKKVNALKEEIWDYEVTDVGADDYIAIMQLIATKKQAELFNKYKNNIKR